MTKFSKSIIGVTISNIGMNEKYSDKQTIIDLSDEESEGEELESPSVETRPETMPRWAVNDAVIIKMRANLCAFIFVWLFLLLVIMLVLFLKISTDGDDFFSTETEADNMTVYIRK